MPGDSGVPANTIKINSAIVLEMIEKYKYPSGKKKIGDVSAEKDEKKMESFTFE